MTKRMSKPKQLPKGERLSSNKPEDSARAAMHPEVNAALIMDAFSTFGRPDVSTTVQALADSGNAVTAGKTGDMERMLISQAHALEAMFTKLARNAMGQDMLPQFEAHLKLALRAQNQCRMTLETLATIKNPPVVFAKQANMGQNVQVNNDTRARENEKPQPELLESPHAKPQWLDTGATRTPAPSHQEVEAMGAIDGAKNKGRKGKGKP